MRAALLLAALLPLTSTAGDVQSTFADSPRPHARRSLILRLSELRDPQAPVREVFVAGGTSTILTTPWGIQPRGTGVAGRGENPVQVAFGPKRLFLTPTRPLLPGERWPLVVRLGDDTVVPLVLVAAPPGRGADGEVALSLDDDDAAELRLELAVATARADGLADRLRQALQERDSEDFALAGLLAGNHAQLTALARVQERFLASDRRGQIKLLTFAPTRHDTSKAGLVLIANNRGAEPLELSVADLFRRSTLERVPRASRSSGSIPPGAQGRLAVVLDGAALGEDAGGLSLELNVSRGGAATELPVVLTPDDFTPPSRWWPF